jgi:hypothetical protein
VVTSDPVFAAFGVGKGVTGSVDGRKVPEPERTSKAGIVET